MLRLGSARLRHRDPVAVLEFAPGGDALASSGHDGAVTLWDPEDGARLFHRRIGGTVQLGLSFASDGKELLLAGGDSIVRTWRFREEEAKPFQVEESARQVRLAPDGRTFAATGHDTFARILDAETGATIHSVSCGDLLPGAAAFSPDGATLAVIAVNRNKLLQRRGFQEQPSAVLHLIDTATGEERTPIVAQNVVLQDLAWLDGARLLTCDAKGDLKIWDAASAELLRGVTVPEAAPARCMALAPAGDLVAIGLDDGTVSLRTLAEDAEKRELARLEVGRMPVADVAIAPDGGMLAAAAGIAVRLWTLPEAEPHLAFPRHAGPVSAVAFADGGARIATASYDHTLRLWDAADGGEVQNVEASAGFVFGLASHGGRVVTAGQDGTVRTWAPAEASEESEQALALGLDLVAHGAATTGVALSADGATIASVGADKTLALWDAETGVLKRRIEGLRGLRFVVSFAPEGNRVAVGSIDLQAFEVQSGEEAFKVSGFGAPITTQAWSPDGATIAVGLADRSIRLLDGKTGDQIHVLYGHLGRLNAVAFSPDSRTLASASAHELGLRLWDVAKGEELRRLEGHDRDVLSLAFSPDGKLVAAGSMDASVLVWRVAD